MFHVAVEFTDLASPHLLDREGDCASRPEPWGILPRFGVCILLEGAEIQNPSGIFVASYDLDEVAKVDRGAVANFDHDVADFPLASDLAAGFDRETLRCEFDGAAGLVDISLGELSADRIQVKSKRSKAVITIIEVNGFIESTDLFDLADPS